MRAGAKIVGWCLIGAAYASDIKWEPVVDLIPQEYRLMAFGFFVCLFLWTMAPEARKLLQKWRGTTSADSDGDEWEVMSWHGETGRWPDEVLEGVFRTKRFPHTLRNKKTGDMKVIPHPRKSEDG